MKRDDKEFCISLDVIVEILKKLPVKSLLRFKSVSKQWRTIIRSSRYFIESIITRSLTKPPQKLPLFIFHHCLPETFFTVSSVFSQNTKPVYVPGSSHHDSFEYQYVRGLICCSSQISHSVTIYNPTTRQSLLLPEIKLSPLSWNVLSYCYFGYDPIMNQYKVLKIIVKEWKQTYHVFTLEQGECCWRKIQGIGENEKITPIMTMHTTPPVYIKGTIYFGASRQTGKHKFETLIMSFNIRAEKFDHVWVPKTLFRALSITSFRDHRTLVNYKGKLGCICYNEEDTSIWIMDNAEKQEWSRIIFSLPVYPLRFLGGFNDKFSGVTPVGEIFVTSYSYESNKSFYVYYYNMKQNSFRRVEMQVASPVKMNKPTYCVYVFPIHDHVENTMWL